MTDQTAAPDPNATPAATAPAPPAEPAAAPQIQQVGPNAGKPIVTELSPEVAAPTPDARTDGERHQDLLREVADHSAPPVGAEQVMMKEGEDA